jgi:Exopolysaccharide biosynthesis protein related to N-acetylglucosamine-1-phosphodiester alpha-N-acetylglucosaminidase
MKNKRRIKSRFIVPAAAFLLIISILAYIAANRFLIEHIEAVVTPASAAASETLEAYKVTDTSYISDSKKITISKVTSGSGSNQVTYYVADIVLDDASELKSAFAKNIFGTNVIQYVSEMASQNNAILAINGDYYGFRKDGIIIRNGVIYRDSPAREGLAVYADGSMKVYDEKTTSAEILLKEGVINTLSFGPTLLDGGAIVPKIETYEVDVNFGNHSIQGNEPRTGIGFISSNHFIFVVVDGRQKGYSVGVTLTEFAEIFKNLGCTEAYNIDGGGSAEMYFMGKVLNTPSNNGGKERGTSDILYIS